MSSPDYPDNAKHQAMFVLPYEKLDGPYAGKTDCKYLSVGWAQWDHRKISVKTHRHSGKRWSRQSEELPVHRAVDAVLLLLLSLCEGSEDGITIPAGTFEGQASEIKIEAKNREGFAEFAKVLQGDGILKNRLRKLVDFACQVRKDGVL
jgi:hypothetical protein